MAGVFEQDNSFRLRSLAHDLASPLSVIKLNLELLSDDNSVPREVLHRMERGISVIQSLLEAETSSGANQGSDVNNDKSKHSKVSEIVKSVAEDNGLLAGIIGVQIRFNLIADKQVQKPETLYRVINNLVRNSLQAIKEMPDPADGIVEISTQFKGARLQITVSDNGPGIDPEIFSKLGKTKVTSKKEQGHGLGLLGAAKILRADYGGEIECVKKTNGQCGACFRILI